ncbi:hypothetical protein BOV90_06075 [Solemya velum gill symbiont]|nr:hypothetical protein BOV90_06075 [Solemya velum gill symbiont]OOY44715.1 hypothetical protein BOV92_08060 [Solemya velum gill symbiont]OOY46503.1 hypothetical protein BOV93_10025 [Solemya velum gill symbiont]OOY50091.1 hypothetical protein BOV94_08390 [Solemya velum gill symbiont]
MLFFAIDNGKKAGRNMAWLREKNGRFYLAWKESGKERTSALGKITRKKAEVELALFEARAETPNPSGMTFFRFAEKYLCWHKCEYPSSHSRIYQIINQHLVPAFRFEMIGVLKPERVEGYKAGRMKSCRKIESTGEKVYVALTTVQKEIHTLKAMLNKAVEWGIIKANPIKYVKPPKDTKDAPPPFYSGKQLATLYEASNPMHEGIWRLAANTGLRRGELIQLRKDDLKEQGIQVISREGHRTKSGKWRLVPWTDGAKAAIQSLSGVDGDFVIPRVHGASLSRAFVTDAKRADLPGSLHWLRHTFASHLVMNNMPLRVVQQVMGHSTIAVTERYAHLSDDYMRDKMSGFSI